MGGMGSDLEGKSGGLVCTYLPELKLTTRAAWREGPTTDGGCIEETGMQEHIFRVGVRATAPILHAEGVVF
jgi:hypothetical protein